MSRQDEIRTLERQAQFQGAEGSAARRRLEELKRQPEQKQPQPVFEQGGNSGEMDCFSKCLVISCLPVIYIPKMILDTLCCCGACCLPSPCDDYATCMGMYEEYSDCC